MVDVKDVRSLRIARAELCKRGIDTMRADVRVSHGILYVRGSVCAMQGSQIADIKTEVEHVAQILRQRADIHDVVLDCSFGERAGGNSKSRQPAVMTR